MPVPEAALREAVLNAVIHKDYATGTPIQISVYADKLMIWNPGQLPPRWTVAKLKGKHSSQPFNPDIANAFFRAGEIEAWGRGIERILEACRAEGSPAPRIKYEASGLWISFRFPPANRGETPVEAPVETPVEAREKRPLKTSERILELLTANPQMTLVDVAASIGRSLRAVERASAKLVKESRLRHVGPTKAGHWEVIK